ncbi:MAG TPA: patatin-like phospholipase family protein [Candidatus Binataceae bacterium]|nr:patatin-like phospholipase family protein [Candidatus Binataceae bacterium]
MSYLILSFDGGGIRGAFSARLVQRLAGSTALLARAALFAGTSTGGIIALGLAAGIPVSQIVDLYLRDAPRIFHSSFVDEMASLGSLSGPKYQASGRFEALQEIFGFMTLGVLQRDVIVTAYDCEARAPVRFSRETPAVTAVTAAMAGSAPPVFFSAVGSFIDGGVAANDPAMVALAWAIGHGHKLDEIWMLSVGTGNAHPPPIKPGAWGGVQWLDNGLIDVLLEGPAQCVDEQCRNLLGRRYLRLDGDVDCAIDETRDLEARLIVPADAINLQAAIQWTEIMLTADAI